MSKAGVTMFEVLLYISLFALLSSTLSIFTFQFFTYVSSIKDHSRRFMASFYINKLIQYNTDRSEVIRIGPDIDINNNYIIFETKEKTEEKVIGLAEIQKITKYIVGIKSVHFLKKDKNNIKNIEVQYMLADVDCSSYSAGKTKTDCIENILINLI